MLLAALHGNASQQVENQDQCNPLEVEVEVEIEIEVEVPQLGLDLGRLAQHQLKRQQSLTRWQQLTCRQLTPRWFTWRQLTQR